MGTVEEEKGIGNVMRGEIVRKSDRERGMKGRKGVEQESGGKRSWREKKRSKESTRGGGMEGDNGN